MKRNEGMIGATLALLCLMAGGASACKNNEGQGSVRKKPNVLILFSDQHNKKVMGFEGHPDVLTPTLDQLAGEGLVLTGPTLL